MIILGIFLGIIGSIGFLGLLSEACEDIKITEEDDI